MQPRASTPAPGLAYARLRSVGAGSAGARRARLRVLGSMLAAIVVVTTMAWWDEQREADAALRDLEAEQTVLASSVASGLGARLATVERDAKLIGAFGARDDAASYDPAQVRAASSPPARSADPSRLLLTVPVGGGRAVDLGVSVGALLQGARRPVAGGDLEWLVKRHGDSDFRTQSSAVVHSSALVDAIERGLPAVRLSRAEAAEIGLRGRTAMAGLAHVDAGALGRWDVAAIASAARERDREKRALWRLVSSVVVASGLVLLFGGGALAKQRRELELAHQLKLSELERERDEHLSRAGRVATMGTFAMGIAHEVSTPLGVIVGRAEQLLGRLREDERSARSARAILDQADRIQHIVRRFLDMARGGPLSFATTDPAEIVRSAAAALEHRFAKAGVSLLTDLPETLPDIRCDRDLLEQALVNLLLNACEAAGRGGHVELAARGDAERVAFIVTDDGAGISPEHAARAAEPFFTTKPAGSGLGLAIATEIAKSHRGSLTIGPSAVRGTRACIQVPTASADTPPPAVAGRGDASKEEGEARREPRRDPGVAEGQRRGGHE